MARGRGIETTPVFSMEDSATLGKFNPGIDVRLCRTLKSRSFTGVDKASPRL